MYLSQTSHSLWPQIEKTISDQLEFAQQGLGNEDDPSGGWELLAKDGMMRLYSRELVIDGLVCDPLKAVTVVRGVTAFEVCHTFFHPATRYDWEQTLESMKIVEKLDENTLVFHQTHKRVWPTTQRDAVFWSHIRQIQNPKASCLSDQDISPQNDPDLKLLDVWIVCNNSTDSIDVPLNGYVRVKLSVAMVCETYVGVNISAESIVRDNLTCKIMYSATINPGGWAPAAMLRIVYKREFVKFLSNFSKYVVDTTKNKPINYGSTN